MQKRLRSFFLLALVALSGLALAQPGQPLPSFSGRDLRGRMHQSSEYSNRRTLLVVMTDRNGGDGMRRWFDTADTRMPPSVFRLSIISLQLPFYASWGRVRDRAAREVPVQYWGDTLLDRDGTMAKTLGLAPSLTPYVFVLDDSGRVVTQVHADVRSPQAEQVWSAFRESR